MTESARAAGAPSSSPSFTQPRAPSSGAPAPGSILRVTRAVLAHKRLVVCFWVVVTIVGVASAGSATKALKQKFSVPGKEGWITNQQIAHGFHGTGGNNSALLPVVTLPPGASVNSPSVRSELAGVEQKMATILPGSRIAGYASTHNSAF